MSKNKLISLEIIMLLLVAFITFNVAKSTDTIRILLVSADGGYNQYYGTSLKEFKSALDKGGYFYDIWIESVKGRITDSSVLKPYDIVIWTCGDYASMAIPTEQECVIMDYVNKGGNILIEGEMVAFSIVKYTEGALLDFLSVYFMYYSLDVSGIIPNPDLPHLINEGLGTVNWATTPTRGPNGVYPKGNAYPVMYYIGTNFSAVTVVEGNETGKGSVVYYSFALFNLPEGARNILVSNSIRWFIQQSQQKGMFEFSSIQIACAIIIIVGLILAVLAIARKRKMYHA